MLLLGILELILLLLGGGSQGFLEQFLPDDLSNAQHAEIGIDADQSIFTQVLDWLYLSHVPLFVWLIIFLTIYGLTGFIIQSIFHHFTAQFLAPGLLHLPVLEHALSPL